MSSQWIRPLTVENLHEKGMPSVCEVIIYDSVRSLEIVVGKC